MKRALHEDASYLVRRESAWVIGKLRLKPLAETLLEGLKRESVIEVKEVILWALGECDPQKLREVKDLFEDLSAKLQAEYIWLLGKHRQSRILKTLLPYFSGSKNIVKRAFIWALAHLKPSYGGRYLRQWYRSEKNKALKEKILWASSQLARSS